MGILKSLGEAVGVSVEFSDEEKKTETNPNITLQPPKNFPPPSLPISATTQDEINSLDKSSKEKLDQAIIAKSPQFYGKLNDLLTTLAEDMPSEAARYKTAIKLLSKEGAAIPSLISDLDLCIGAIESANSDFSTKVSKKIDDQVNTHKTAIATIDSQIQAKTQQIQSLQAELVTLTQNKEQEAGLINTESQKLNLRKDRFTVVYNQLHDQLTAQKQKLTELK